MGKTNKRAAAQLQENHTPGGAKRGHAGATPKYHNSPGMNADIKLDEKWLEFELSMRMQNIRHCLQNLRLLDYYPELKGPIFNRKNINEEIGRENTRCLEIIRELKRRDLP